MRRTSALCSLCLLVFAGCSGDDPQNVPDPKQTAYTGETGAGDTAEDFTGDDWQVRNHFGSVVMRQEGTAKPGDADYIESFAVFGEDLNGVGTGQWCVEKGVCVDELPDRVGDFIDLKGYIRQFEVDYDWVGERITIGNMPNDWIEVPFKYINPLSGDPDSEYGFYNGRTTRLDKDEIPPFDVRVAGEWGDGFEVQGEHGLVIPLLPRLLEPSPASGTFTPAGVVTFNWQWPPDPPKPEPAFVRGDGKLYVRVRSNELDRIYRLPEEGPWDLQLGALGLNPSSNIELSFGRWHRTQVKVQTNTLSTFGVSEVALRAPVCTTYPTVNVGAPPGPAADPAVVVDSIGVGFDGLIDGAKVRDYRWDSDGSGVATDVSATLVFTAYDAQAQAICTVQYDASSATSIPPFLSNSGARVNEAFTIRLQQALTDCPKVQQGILGTNFTDLRQVLESTQWQFGFGEIGLTAAPLAAAYGNEWDDVKGQMWGFFLKRDVDVEGLEVSAGFGYHTADCATLDPDLVPMGYRPGAPIKGGVYSPTPVLLLEAEPVVTTSTSTSTTTPP